MARKRWKQQPLRNPCTRASRPRAADISPSAGETLAAVEALAAYSSGYFLASQALSTAALTSAISNHFGIVGFKAARETFRNFDPDEDGLRLFRFASVMQALATAIEVHQAGDPPRHRFNRHNAAHSLGEPQYRQVNSLTALMLLVSVELELEFVAAEMAGPDS